MTSKEFILEIRPSGIGPIFVGSYKPGDKIEQWPIDSGNQVALKSEGITVIADVTRSKGNSFEGAIVGFENYLEECLNSKCVGDTIEFKFENIFGCSR